jgi:lysozyme
MPTTKVIDLSASNTIPKDLKAAKAAGVIGMVHQASAGTNQTDEKAEARVYLAKEAGLLTGLYHCLSNGTTRRQADSFVTFCEALGLKDNWLLAVQVDGKISADEAAEFLEIVEQKTRRSPVLFASADFLAKLKGTDQSKLSKYRLWIAQHDTVVDVPVAFGKYFLWQYSDEGSVDGVEGDVGCSDSLIQEADALKTVWSGFKGKTDKSEEEAAAEPSNPGEPESGTAPAEPQEPTMTPEGELDNAPAEPQAPTMTPDGELDKPAPDPSDPLEEYGEEDGEHAPPTAPTPYKS